MKTMAVVSVLTKQIKKIRQEVAMLEADLQKMERAKAMLEQDHAGVATRPRRPKRRLRRPSRHGIPSITTAAMGILRQSGKPLSGKDLRQRLRTKGIRSSQSTVMSTLYHNVRSKKLTLPAPGQFGLPEWKQAGKTKTSR